MKVWFYCISDAANGLRRIGTANSVSNRLIVLQEDYANASLKVEVERLMDEEDAQTILHRVHAATAIELAEEPHQAKRTRPSTTRQELSDPFAEPN